MGSKTFEANYSNDKCPKLCEKLLQRSQERSPLHKKQKNPEIKFKNNDTHWVAQSLRSMYGILQVILVV